MEVVKHETCLEYFRRRLREGWKCISLEEAVIINTVTVPYNRAEPDEYRKDPHKSDIPYLWERKDG